MDMVVNGQPDRIAGLTLSASVFRALGVQPALGRAYTVEEDLGGNQSVIVLSYEFWQKRLGGRSDVLNLTLTADGRIRTVVGVMPHGFTVVGEKADFLVPFGQTVEQLRAVRGRGSSYAIARLRAGVSLEQASSEMRRMFAELAKEAPQLNARRTVILMPLHEQLVGDLRPAVLALVGAVGLVLLVACVNVANLLLARSNVRQREFSIRTALGASQSRVVRQLLTESVLLAITGGALGFAIGKWGTVAALAAAPNGSFMPTIPRAEEIGLDFRVLLFTLAVSVVTRILFGLVPALRMSKRNLGDTLKDTARSISGHRSRMQAMLVIGEMAMALVLLVGAGLMLRTLVQLWTLSPGFELWPAATAAP